MVFKEEIIVDVKGKDNASSSIDKTDDSVRKLGKTAEQTGKDFERMGAAAAKVGAAITAVYSVVLVKAISVASQFEKRLANIATLVDGDVNVVIKEFREELLKIETPTSLNELADGLFFVQSAGIGGGEGIDVLTQANKLAIAGNTDTATALKAVIGFTRAYGKESISTAEATDLLFQINKKGVTTFEEVANAAAITAAGASVLNVDQRELAASMATLVGTSGDMANVSTQLNGIFTALSKPSEALQEKFREIGFESGFAAVSSLGFVGTLKAIRDASGGTDEGLSKLFNNSRAIRGIIPLLGAQFDTLTQNIIEMDDAAGAVNIAFEKQLSTFSAQAAILKKDVNVVFERLGNFLLPTLVTIVQKLGDVLASVVKWWDRLSAGTKKAIGFTVAAIGTLGVLLTVFGTLIFIIGKLIGVWLLLANPITAIGVAIVIVIGLIVALIKEWETFKDSVIILARAIAAGFKESMDIVVALFRNAINSMIAILEIFRKAIVSAFENMFNVIKFIWNGIFGFLSTILIAIKDVFISIWTDIVDTITALWNTLVGVVQAVINTIVGIFRGAKDLITSAFKSMFSGIKSIATNVFGSVLNTISGFVNTAIKGLNKVINLANRVNPLTDIPTVGEVDFAQAPAEQVQEFANGGIVQGLGGIDSVPARLTPGEQVLTPKQQSEFGRGIVINISGNSFFGDDDEFAERIGDKIMESVGQQLKIPSF